MKKHIPNSLTCCNLISGCIAIFYAVYGLLPISLMFIIIGAVFDFFDGMVARLLHVSSPIGKELDSLADVVTFGVAPSIMLCKWMAFANMKDEWLVFLPLLMAAFSALRLAKFNLDERQTMGFIGLPTPANALFWASLLTTLFYRPDIIFPLLAPILMVIMLLCCYLLVSEIPMFALKFKYWGWKGNEVRYVFLLTCIPMLVFLKVAGIAAIIVWYVALSMAVALRGHE